MSKKVGKDLLLAFIYAEGKTGQNNEAIWGRTRIEKMMFIFEKELSAKFFKDEDVLLPEFIPYLYGPYSIEVLDDLNFFIDIDFIEEIETSVSIQDEMTEIHNYAEWEDSDLWEDETDEIPKNKYEMSYALTDKGMKYVAENIWVQLTDNQRSVIIRLKTQINNMLLDDLLSYVYRKYPEYAEESKIRDRYLEDNDS